MADLATNTPIWISHPEEAFVERVFVRAAGDKAVVKDEAGKEETVAVSDVMPKNPIQILGVEDMTGLLYLNEPGILQNLAYRFDWDLVYTFVGSILIAINPFKGLGPYYAKSMMECYRNCIPSEISPHAFAVSDQAYSLMSNGKVSQSIIISGESGAGKTETTKICMKYLADVGGTLGVGRIEEQIMQSNPILEAFGNAKTLRNDNSSRFGKFIQLQFDTDGHVIGAMIENYLLEKSRLVFQAKNERNYHILYQLLAGSSEEDKSRMKLGSPDDYHYTNQSYCTDIPGVNDGKDFQDVIQAFRTIGLPQEELDSVQRILAFILHCGNVTFNVGAEDAAILRTEVVLQTCAELLRVDYQKLHNAVVKKRIKAGLEFVIANRKVEEAMYSRDAMAKAIYAKMFDVIVLRINRSLSHIEKMSSFIGVLDIFGFESFVKNSFEQICINYANEKLQQFFNQHIFKMEQAEYDKEKIDWSNIDFVDNQECLDLIEKKLGILDLLDEECRIGSGSDKSFSEKVAKTWGKNSSRFLKPKPDRKRGIKDTDFIINHFAGEVCYDVEDWLDKNNDALHPDLSAVINSSSDPFVAALFESTTGNEDAKAGQRKKLVTVGSQFKEQLVGLMASLGKTRPHFIRCIKPNPEKKPGYINKLSVSQQLHCGGVLEAVRIQRTGWPTRLPHDEFYIRYRILVPGSEFKPADYKAGCKTLMDHFAWTTDKYQLGLSKIFFRASGMDFFEDKRKKVFTLSAVKVQRVSRGHGSRVFFRQMKAAGKVIAGMAGAYYRTAKARRVFITKILNSIAIQKNWRSYFLRKRFKQIQVANETLQRVGRGWYARKKLLPKAKERHAARMAAKRAKEEAERAAKKAKEEAERAAAALAAAKSDEDKVRLAKELEASQRAIQEASAAITGSDLNIEDDETHGDAEGTEDTGAGTQSTTFQQKSKKQPKEKDAAEEEEVVIPKIDYDDVLKMPVNEGFATLVKRIDTQDAKRMMLLDSAKALEEQVRNLINETGANIPQESSVQFGGLFKSGWLNKCQQANSTFSKRRWFVLSNQTLTYQRAMLERGEVSGTIVLDPTTTVRIAQVSGGRYFFDITQPQRTFYLSAGSAAEREDWVNLIREACRFDERRRMSIAAEDDLDVYTTKTNALNLAHTMASQATEKEGPLQKQGTKPLQRLHTRYAVIKGSIFFYFCSVGDSSPLDCVPLEACSTQALKVEQGKFPFSLEFQKKVTVWFAPSLEAREEWLQTIQRVKMRARLQMGSTRRDTISIMNNPPNSTSNETIPISEAIEKITASGDPNEDGVLRKKMNVARDMLSLDATMCVEWHTIMRRSIGLMTALKNILYVHKEGWLFKTKMINGTIRHWDKRWFVLMDKVLYYFKQRNDAEPAGFIMLDNCYIGSIEQMVNDMSKKFSFTVSVPDNVYVLCAETHTDMKEWVRALETEAKAEDRQKFSSTVGLRLPGHEKVLVEVSYTDDEVVERRLAALNMTYKTQTMLDSLLENRTQLLSRELAMLKRKLGKSQKTTMEEAMKASVSALSNPDKEGWLMKTHTITGPYKGWRRRYFVIKDDFLYYFKTKQDTEPTGVINLEGCQTRVLDDVGVENCFEISSKNLKYFLRGNSEDQMREWISLLDAASMIIMSSKATTSSSTHDDDLTAEESESRWSNPQRTGWLLKASGKNVSKGSITWQRRWMVLKGLSLCYFKTAQDQDPAGVVSLDGCSFDLSKKAEKRLDIVTPQRRYSFMAEAEVEIEEWVEAMKTVKIEEAKRINATVDVGALSSTSHQMARLLFPEKQGFLTKQGAFVKSWKRRWFVLQNAMLFYFVTQEDYPLKPKGTVPLVEECVVRMNQDPEVRRDFCLELWHPSLDSYYIAADSEPEKVEWMNALRKTIGSLQELRQQQQQQATADADEEEEPGAQMLESSTFMTLRKMGYLLRLDKGIREAWNKRLYTLKNGFLLCYKERDSEIYPEQVIPLRKCTVHDAEQETKKKFTFEIRHPKLKQSYFVQAPNREDMKDWMQAIRDTTAQFERQDAVLNVRRAKEREVILGIDQSKSDGGLFVIDAQWVHQWNEFSMEGSSAPPPGPISNSNLLMGGIPKPCLVKGRDYRVVNRQTFETFLKMYGGGPTLADHTFESALQDNQNRGKFELGASSIGLTAPPPPPSFLPPPPPSLTDTTVGGAHDDSGTEVFKEGYLHKSKSPGALGWKRRYFILKGGNLRWYKSQTEKELLGFADITKATINMKTQSSRKHCFEIQTTEKTYYIEAQSEMEMKQWVQSLEEAKFVQSVIKQREEREREAKAPPTIVGIGIILRHDRGDFVVEQIIEGGPADLSQKLRVGDWVVEVDGTSTNSLEFNAVLDLIRGEQGSFVQLTVCRRTVNARKSEEEEAGAAAGEPETQYINVELRRDVVRRIDLYTQAYSSALSSGEPVHIARGDIRTARQSIAPTATRTTSATGPQRSGFMFKSKKSGMQAMLSIQNRWFVLRGSDLFYFKNRDDAEPIDTLSMLLLKSIKSSGELKGHFGIELVMPKKSYYIWAQSREDRAEWIEAINAARNPQ